MRRVEMARRRKNLSEKRNEEEKMDTINRLLKKQAPKRRRKADVEADRIAEEGGGEAGEDMEGVERVNKVNKVFVRYTSRVGGPVLGVPREWVEGGWYGGGVFGGEPVKGEGERK